MKASEQAEAVGASGKTTSSVTCSGPAGHQHMQGSVWEERGVLVLCTVVAGALVCLAPLLGSGAVLAALLLHRRDPRRFIPHGLGAAVVVGRDVPSTARLPGRDPLPTQKEPFAPPFAWLRGKREADAQARMGGIAAHCHCIRGQLYDLSRFYDVHPGGREWLELTAGTDCTEAYEVHHLHSERVDPILAKYCVGPAEYGPKGGDRFTFAEQGLYRTLKERVAARLGTATGPTPYFLAVCYATLAAWCGAFCLLCVYPATWAALLAGLLLHGLLGVGHNFFHKGDRRNHLKYAFDLSGFSSHAWRISHVLVGAVGVLTSDCRSHHLYPNLELDLEVTGFEPFLHMMDNRPKNNPFAALTLNVMASHAILIDLARHLLLGVVGREPLRWEDALVVLEMAVLWYFQQWEGLWCWYVMQAFASWLLVMSSFTVHRTEHAWTESDPGPRADYAEHILLTTQEHSLEAPLPVAMVGFALLNRHVLHHLFPTVDYSRLGDCHDILVDTCAEFGVPYRPYTFTELFRSFLRKFDIRA